MSNYNQVYSCANVIIKLLEAYMQQERGAAAAQERWLVDLQPGLLPDLAALRRKLCIALHGCDATERAMLSQNLVVLEACIALRGALFRAELAEDEARLIADHQHQLSAGFGADRFISYLILSFYYQPYHLPLPERLSVLPEYDRAAFLKLALRQPQLMQIADEPIYLQFYEMLGDWVIELIEDRSMPAEEKSTYLVIVSQSLTFGACYYVDHSTIALVKQRVRILTVLLQALTPLQTLAKRVIPTRSDGIIRLGIITRTLADYTDTRALLALFQAFDPKRYAFYWYALEPEVSDKNTDFTRYLKRVMYRCCVLTGDAITDAQTIIADDLDFLFVGTAYSFGLRALDQLLALPLARLRVRSLALVPGSSGMKNSDILIIPQAEAATAALFQAESTERLVAMEGPLLWYQRPEPVPPAPHLTRAALGIAEDAIVYVSGAAVNKQMDGTLRTWLHILQRVPSSVLLLFPFNPAWGGYYLALTFLARLRAVLQDYPDIHSDRIKILRAVSPEDSDRLLQLSDIYLGSFPRDGGTMAMKALFYGLPLIARKERWLHTPHDALMLRSLGLDEWIGADNAAVTAMGIRLGLDSNARRTVRQQITAGLPQAAFFDTQSRSKKLQAIFDALAKTHFGQS